MFGLIDVVDYILIIYICQFVIGRILFRSEQL